LPAGRCEGDKHIESTNAIYQSRRDVLVKGLSSLGWQVKNPQATFYVWIKNIKGQNSASMAKMLLDKANIIATPGNGFGASGEGYIRMTLTVPEERLVEAVKRIKKL